VEAMTFVISGSHILSPWLPIQVEAEDRIWAVLRLGLTVWSDAEYRESSLRLCANGEAFHPEPLSQAPPFFIDPAPWMNPHLAEGYKLLDSERRYLATFDPSTKTLTLAEGVTADEIAWLLFSVHIPKGPL
jgi:hypothetical protein